MRRDKVLRRAAQGARGNPPERESRFLAAALGREGDSHGKAYVALKYFRHHFQCFSEWDRDELRAFGDFNAQVSQRTWNQIHQSGGRGANKAGLGYTPHDGSKMPENDLADVLSEDLTWIELWVTQTARVHGFRAGQAFFLVFLDRNHELLS